MGGNKEIELWMEAFALRPVGYGYVGVEKDAARLF